MSIRIRSLFVLFALGLAAPWLAAQERPDAVDPIQALKRASAALQEGKLDAEAQARLAQHLQQLARHLAEQREALKQREVRVKEFVEQSEKRTGEMKQQIDKMRRVAEEQKAKAKAQAQAEAKRAEAKRAQAQGPGDVDSRRARAQAQTDRALPPAQGRAAPNPPGVRFPPPDQVQRALEARQRLADELGQMRRAIRQLNARIDALERQRDAAPARQRGVETQRQLRRDAAAPAPERRRVRDA